ncbi:hypothetical protein Cpir12675_000558 [Ceratocystis pirilliformis]|uniref:Zn(2)-C6 fungal-type domain-containing protein n=1 Tax=Ceratocystis pirilliformis TaxID=259994 RepID=A0ABR3ZLS5_9PEZI
MPKKFCFAGNRTENIDYAYPDPNSAPNLTTPSNFPNLTPYISEGSPSFILRSEAEAYPSKNNELDIPIRPLLGQNDMPQMEQILTQQGFQTDLSQGNMLETQYNPVQPNFNQNIPELAPGQGDMQQIQQNLIQKVPQPNLMDLSPAEHSLLDGYDLESWAASPSPSAIPFNPVIYMPIQAPLEFPNVVDRYGAVPEAPYLVDAPPKSPDQIQGLVWYKHEMPQDNRFDLPAGQNMIPPNQFNPMPSKEQHPFQDSLPPTTPHNHSARAQQPPSQDSLPPKAPPNGESAANVSRPMLPGSVPIQPSKKQRGSFTLSLRKETAETRAIGSCVRCQMQRIRCVINKKDREGECATCESARPNTKFWRLPCLRYKITGVELYKPLTNLQDLAWTKRGTTELLEIKNFRWQSTQMRTIWLADGHTDISIKLTVRRFLPKDGDKMKRTWVTSNGELRSVDATPYAISDPDAAYRELEKHLSEMAYQCMQKVVLPLGEVMFKTYSIASDASKDPKVSVDEKSLLQCTLKLWMSIRLTTTSQHIIGEDTLDMQNVSDDTSPLYGKVPVPPVLGAQVDVLLIDRIQNQLRQKVLKLLKEMILRNKKQEWFSLYLAIFIIMHNIALIIAHDALYARKHGLKRRYARPERVQEYHKGANTILGYFHYSNKSHYPFSSECKDQGLKALVELDDKRMQFIQDTRKYVRSKEAEWQEMREQSQNGNDFFYVSQLFQKEWKPMDIDTSASA